MKKYILIIIAGVILIQSCKKKEEDEDLTGDWIKRSNFEGVSRSSAVGFTINDKIYVGTGFDGTDRLKDFWEFDPEQNFWQQKSDLPGPGRSEAIGFSTTSNGYVGTGYDGIISYNDFYEYAPSTNTWIQKANFPSTPRYGSVAFQLYDKGYVGAGYDGNYKKDFFKYDPLNDAWSVIPSLGGEKRMDAVAVTLNQKGYVLSGQNNGFYVNDVWEYNPIDNLWYQKSDLAIDDDDDGSWDRDLRRSNASAFVMNDKGYLVGGFNSGYQQSLWEYEPNSDDWTQRVDFEGSARMDGVGVSIGNRGFILTGRNANNRYDDFWEFVE